MSNYIALIVILLFFQSFVHAQEDSKDAIVKNPKVKFLTPHDERFAEDGLIVLRGDSHDESVELKVIDQHVVLTLTDSKVGPSQNTCYEVELIIRSPSNDPDGIRNVYTFGGSSALRDDKCIVHIPIRISDLGSDLVGQFNATFWRIIEDSYSGGGYGFGLEVVEAENSSVDEDISRLAFELVPGDWDLEDIRSRGMRLTTGNVRVYPFGDDMLRFSFEQDGGLGYDQNLCDVASLAVHDSSSGERLGMLSGRPVPVDDNCIMEFLFQHKSYAQKRYTFTAQYHNARSLAKDKPAVFDLIVDKFE